jgi:hypothetical protein
MKRNTIIAVAIWVLVAGALIIFFSAYSKIPQIVLLIPAVGILAYHVARGKAREPRTGSLVLGRFTPRVLVIAGSTLIALAIVWILFVARAVANDADQTLYGVIIPVLAMIIIGGVLISVAVHNLISRN